MRDVLKGSAMGAGLSVALWLVPGVHFVAGPLGPFFGGLIAGSTARASVLQALAVAALMAAMVGVSIAVLIMTILGGLAAFGIKLPFGGGPDVAALFGGFLAAHAFLLGSLGAMLGGALARRSAKTPQGST